MAKEKDQFLEHYHKANIALVETTAFALVSYIYPPALLGCIATVPEILRQQMLAYKASRQQIENKIKTLDEMLEEHEHSPDQTLSQPENPKTTSV